MWFVCIAMNTVTWRISATKATLSTNSHLKSFQRSSLFKAEFWKWAKQRYLEADIQNIYIYIYTSPLDKCPSREFLAASDKLHHYSRVYCILLLFRTHKSTASAKQFRLRVSAKRKAVGTPLFAVMQFNIKLQHCLFIFAKEVVELLL